MKKDRVVAGVAEALDADLVTAKRCVCAVMEAIKKELLAGSRVTLTDFASLRIVERKARVVRSPDTGQQVVSPADNVVRFVPIDSFREAIVALKLSSIVLAVPGDDTFARVIESHFTHAGWNTRVVHSQDDCLTYLRSAGTNLVIVDGTLEGAEPLIAELKCVPETSTIPLIVLYPKERDPECSTAFHIRADEYLVEPFEVYTLLMLAESELARSNTDEATFEQRVRFQFGGTEENLELAGGLAERLFGETDLDEEEQVALGYAFREALGNAAQHGNGNDPGKRIRVRYSLDREKVTIVVTDAGAGFDHGTELARCANQDALAAARERRAKGGVGGLGIMLMLKCSDRVEYNHTGNRVALTKLRRRRS
ncbi:ATP-binding protein [Planctomycetota bacterium]